MDRTTDATGLYPPAVQPPDWRADPRVMDALGEATRAIAGELSLDRVLQVIVDRVRPLVGAEYAALGTVDADGLIERFITSGMDAETRRRIGPLPRGYGLLGLIIRENRSIRIADIGRDPNRAGFPEHHPEMRTFLGVPVNVKGRSVGNLYLTNRADGEEFSEADQDLVETFALSAGIAIENARLHAEVARLAIVEERERIGRDLHDGVIQGIYAVGLSLEDLVDLMDEDRTEAVHRIERAIDSLHATIRDIRNFIFELRPELLEGATLVGALGAIVDEFRHNTVIDVELSIEDAIEEPSPERAATVLAIAREALSNVARHSRASQAELTLSATGDGLRLVIADNGAGFEVDRDSGFGHHGLANMRDRAEVVGGTFAVDSRPGRGTRILIDVPAEAGETIERMVGT